MSKLIRMQMLRMPLMQAILRSATDAMLVANEKTSSTWPQLKKLGDDVTPASSTYWFPI